MLPFQCFLTGCRSDAAEQFSFKLGQTVMNDDAASGHALLVRKSASQRGMPSGSLCRLRAAAMKEAAGVRNNNLACRDILELGRVRLTRAMGMPWARKHQSTHY